MERKIKDLLLYIYFKYHRIVYLLKYKIPVLNVDIEKERFVNFIDWVGPIKSVAIVGKGASVLETNPKELIQGCNFKCLMNSIDIDFLEAHIGKNFDAQMTSVIGNRMIKLIGWYDNEIGYSNRLIDLISLVNDK